MKQRFFLSCMAIVFSVLSVSAQNEEKLVVNTGNVEHISIANDMNIVLMPSTDRDRSISLDAKASEKLSLRLLNNSLAISSLRQPSRKEKLTVYLYVNNLKTITVENNTTVKTVGILNTSKLDVFIDGGAMVHLKAKGEIKAWPLNDGEIKVKYLSENLLTKKVLIDNNGLFLPAIKQ